MDRTAFLLEYLKEQYNQARQYETRDTNTTTFLTTLAGAILGLGLKGGGIIAVSWEIGALLVLIGAANLCINWAHRRAILYHTAVAGEARRALEEAIPGWTPGSKPTEIRNKILYDHRVKHAESGIRDEVHKRLAWIPLGTIVLGVLVILLSLCRSIRQL